MNSNEIISAYNAPKIGTISPAELKKGINVIFHEAYALAGSEPVEATIISNTATLSKKVAGCYRHLTLAEVRLAIEYGLSGQLGNRTSLQLANVFGWVETYSKSPERIDAIKTATNAVAYQNRYYQSQLPETVEDATKRTDEARIRKFWEWYKEHGWDFWCAEYEDQMYGILEKKGKFRNVTDKTLEECRKRASHRMASQKGLSKLFNTIADTKQSSRFDAFYHAEIVHFYFDTLKERKIELSL